MFSLISKFSGRFGNRNKSASDLLVCIYTCQQNLDLLKIFHSSVIGKYIESLPGATTLEVYADPNINLSSHHGKKLVLKTEENYRALSLKTYWMMKYCIENFDFRHLLKIDVTTVMTQFESPEYKNRMPIDLDEVLRFLKHSRKNTDYAGFLLHAEATRENAENWAAKKGLTINYDEVFDNEHMPPFFSGKCYTVSQRFARFISEAGLDLANEHQRCFPGAEDVMVARLYQKFKAALADV